MTARNHSYFLADRARVVGDPDVADLLRRYWEQTAPPESRESPRLADGVSAWIDEAGAVFAQLTVGAEDGKYRSEAIDPAADPLLAGARELLVARYRA